LSKIVEGMPMVLRHVEGARPNLFNLITLVPGETTPVRKFIESVAVLSATVGKTHVGERACRSNAGELMLERAPRAKE
jgi:hypothetical protein